MKTHSPYLKNAVTVKKIGNQIKITQHKALRQKGWEQEKPRQKRGTASDRKSQGNISKAIRSINNIGKQNNWVWWCNFNLDATKIDRYDFMNFKKTFLKFIANQNRYRCSNRKIKYLIVFGIGNNDAWHAHAFITGLDESDLSTTKVNDNISYHWDKYEKNFGFSYILPLTNVDYRIAYMVDNVKKVSERTELLNMRLYYSSKNLTPKETLLFSGTNVKFKKAIPWTYTNINGYCRTSILNAKKYSWTDFIEIPEEN